MSRPVGGRPHRPELLGPCQRGPELRAVSDDFLPGCPDLLPHRPRLYADFLRPDTQDRDRRFVTALI